MGYLLIASYLCAHFAFFAVALRDRQVFRRESGIILLHLASAAILVLAAMAWFMVEPNEDRLALAVTAAAAHGIYSLTFLEVWALSDGGYSLRLLSDVVRRDTETIDQLERDFATVSTSKKGGRLQSLLDLGLLRDDNGTFALTPRGKVVARFIVFISKLAQIHVSR